MIANETREKLQNIIRGTFIKGQEDHCTTIRNLLLERFETGPTIKSEFESRAILKKRQAEFLGVYSRRTGLLYSDLPSESLYLTSGGESDVYLAADKKLLLNSTMVFIMQPGGIFQQCYDPQFPISEYSLLFIWIYTT